MATTIITEPALLALMQLTSATLPVGAYSYSEGLESLIDCGSIATVQHLRDWLVDSLRYGSIRLDAAILLRVHRSWLQGETAGWMDWNDWLSATRESAELQQQNWQMGRSLTKLLRDLDPDLQIPDLPDINYGVAMAIATAHWHIDEQPAVLGYLQSWVSNLISAGIKLMPLGQTAGQRLLLELTPVLIETSADLVQLGDADLWGWNWGLALASMAHETQYSRLFRS